MALSKQVKAAAVARMKADISAAKSMVFVAFDKLSVAEAMTLRHHLRAADVYYRVIKKTLLRKALDDSTIRGTIPPLDGSLAIAWSEYDSSTAPREIYNFKKNNHEDQITLVGGIYEGEYWDKARMNELAIIPSMTVLRGMFVNLINSPRQRFAVVLSQYAQRSL